MYLSKYWEKIVYASSIIYKVYPHRLTGQPII